MADRRRRNSSTNLPTSSSKSLIKRFDIWAKKNASAIALANIVFTIVISIVFGLLSNHLNVAQHNLSRELANPQINVRAEFVEKTDTSHISSKYGEAVHGTKVVDSLIVSNGGGLLYQPELRVYPYLYVVAYVRHDYAVEMGIAIKEKDAFEGMYKNKDPFWYEGHVFYWPLTIDVTNRNLYRMTRLNTKQGDLAIIGDTTSTNRIEEILASYTPRFRVSVAEIEGVSTTYNTDVFDGTDNPNEMNKRAMDYVMPAYISLEFFLEVEYSTTYNKDEKQREVYRCVTGHVGELISSDLGSDIGPYLIDPDDPLYEEYLNLKAIRESDKVISYPILNYSEEEQADYLLDLLSLKYELDKYAIPIDFETAKQILSEQAQDRGMSD